MVMEMLNELDKDQDVSDEWDDLVTKAHDSDAIESDVIDGDVRDTNTKKGYIFDYNDLYDYGKYGDVIVDDIGSDVINNDVKGSDIIKYDLMDNNYFYESDVIDAMNGESDDINNDIIDGDVIKNEVMDDNDDIDDVTDSDTIDSDERSKDTKPQPNPHCQELKEQSKEIKIIGKRLKEIVDLLLESSNRRDKSSVLKQLPILGAGSDNSDSENSYLVTDTIAEEDVETDTVADEDVETDTMAEEDVETDTMAGEDVETLIKHPPQNEDHHLGVAGTPSKIKLAGTTSMARCERCENRGEEEVCGVNGQTYGTLCHAVNCAGLALMDITSGACNTKVR